MSRIQPGAMWLAAIQETRPATATTATTSATRVEYRHHHANAANAVSVRALKTVNSSNMIAENVSNPSGPPPELTRINSSGATANQLSIARADVRDANVTTRAGARAP